MHLSACTHFELLSCKSTTVAYGTAFLLESCKPLFPLQAEAELKLCCFAKTLFATCALTSFQPERGSDALLQQSAVTADTLRFHLRSGSGTQS